MHKTKVTNDPLVSESTPHVGAAASLVSRQQLVPVQSAIWPLEPVPPTPETVCGVVVTYHPDRDFFDRIKRVVPQVRQTVIVDNGSSSRLTERMRELADECDIHLILNHRNEGLARALNIGAQWAIEQGYRWLLTLDQDTTVSPEIIQSLGEVLSHYSFPQRLAVVGSNYIDKANDRLCEELVGSDDSASREMTTVLTSGSLISLNVFRAIGGFRDDFFIDSVDHEYCLRARAHGFRVIMTSKPIMKHGIGNLTEHRLLWRRVHTTNHSPVRRYFATRNTLILTREYLVKEPRWTIEHVSGFIKSIILVCLFERERIPKIKYILRGCIDALLGRTGSMGEVDADK
jgi:rhamnosyltransferase